MDDHDEGREPPDENHPDVCECPGCAGSSGWGRRYLLRESLRVQGERTRAAFAGVLGGLSGREREVLAERFGPVAGARRVIP